jgi:hypothetical protein
MMVEYLLLVQNSMLYREEQYLKQITEAQKEVGFWQGRSNMFETAWKNVRL